MNGCTDCTCYQDPFARCPNHVQFRSEPLCEFPSQSVVDLLHSFQYFPDSKVPASVVADCDSNKRRVTKFPKKSCLADVQASKGKGSKCEKLPQASIESDEIRKKSINRPSMNRSTMKRSTIQKRKSSNVSSHPGDCGCVNCSVNCDKSEDIIDVSNGNCVVDEKLEKKESKSKLSKKSTVVTSGNCLVDEKLEKKESKSKLSKKSTVATMSNNFASEKYLKSSMLSYVSESKGSKAQSSIVQVDDDVECVPEVWLLHCPRNFDPRSMFGNKLGSQSKMDGKVERFSEEKALAFIAPEKAAEYKLICESIELLTPVGKIVVSGKKEPEEESLRSQKKSIDVDLQSIGSKSQSGVSKCETDVDSNAEHCDDDEDYLSSSEHEELKPLTGKKMSKKLNDQRFTIETTVTVEKVNDRKKSKKDSEESCLPFVPPEPSPIRQKKKSKRDTVK